MSRGRWWTQVEDAVILEHYAALGGTKLEAMLPGRGRRSICDRASHLKVGRTGRKIPSKQIRHTLRDDEPLVGNSRDMRSRPVAQLPGGAAPSVFDWRP